MKTQMRMTDGFAAQAAMLSPRENRAAAPVQKREASAPEAGLAGRRQEVEDALLALERDVNDHVRGHSTWLSVNWSRFISHANGNPSVAFSRDAFLTIVGGPESVGVGDGIKAEAQGRGVGLVTGLAGAGTTRLMAGSGAKIAGMLASVFVGGAVSVLTSLVWSVVSQILSGKDQEKARHEQSKQQGEDIIEKLNEFQTQEDAAIATSRADLDKARAVLTRAETDGDLGAIEVWMARERAKLGAKKGPSDRTLFEALCANWVLQHSEAPDEESDDTSEDAYDEMLEEKKVNVRVEEGKRLLFIHQLRRGLLVSGLMDEDVVTGLEREADAVLRASNTALVVATFTGRKVSLGRVAHLDAFERTLGQHHDEVEASSRIADFRGPAERGNVKSEAVLRLEEDEGVPVLDAVELRVECTGPDRRAYERGTSIDKEGETDGGFDIVEWSWTP